VTETDIIRTNTDALARALAVEIDRVRGFMRRARVVGKRSRARLNLEPVAAPFGLSPDGYALDCIAGAAYLGTLGTDTLSACQSAIAAYLAAA